MNTAAVLWFLLIGYYTPAGKWATSEVYQVNTYEDCKELGTLLVPKDRLTIDGKIYKWKCHSIPK